MGRGNGVESCAGGEGEGDGGAVTAVTQKQTPPSVNGHSEMRGEGGRGGGVGGYLLHNTAATGLSLRMLSCPLIWTG